MNEEKFKWKCDICGTRFNNFQAEGFNRKIYCPLCFFKELNKQNEQQLQVYKDKEDKIRECCMPLITLNNIDCCKECGSTNIKQNYKPYKIAEDILQILNEGDK